MNGLRILYSTFLWCVVYATAQITSTTTTNNNNDVFRKEGLVQVARFLLQDLISSKDHLDCSLIFFLDSTSYEVVQLSRCVLLVLASDDPSFITVFGERSLKSRLLVWSTKLLILTHLPLTHFQKLNTFLGQTNSMIFITDIESKRTRFTRAPEMVLVAEEYQPHVKLVHNDNNNDEEEIIKFTGPMIDLVNLLAMKLNFT
ncbi:hypothetical protein Pmani_003441 [Petrolisthes manimaculis]|uniref:Uncharacterized protein n=1 Tax=Petrolisthes manimaculis TaxID=1843537 RepID=A0AAE1QGM6_9EUCA|nr:hypothetical protein Pmani_003441 [Petrolisthes manimaculis]